uniref:hypothetical protein n=1 Tax=Acinetobacter ursingii TaxID=108980 RepID=UPI0030087DAF
MNAHKFVAEFGIEEAKRVLRGAPVCSSAFNVINDFVIYYQMCDNWWWYNSAKKEYEMDYGKSMKIDLSELKQVVESVEIVESKGGLRKLKKEANCLFYNGFEGIAESYEKSIADYEAVEACHAKS